MIRNNYSLLSVRISGLQGISRLFSAMMVFIRLNRVPVVLNTRWSDTPLPGDASGVLVKRLFVALVLFCTLILPPNPLTGTNQEESPNAHFPNVIYIDRNQLNGLLSGMISDDPNGVASLLALHAGLTFRNTGDAGAETWFIVRNFGRDNSRMTLVLLDGRPLNLSNNHTVEFDDIPVSIIESITIYPGPVPVQYGGFQSVIDIRTIRNQDIIFTGVSMGTDATYRINSTIGKSGRLYYLANFDLDMSLAQSDRNLAGKLENFRYTNREFRTFLPTFKIGYELNNYLDLTLYGNFVDFKKMFHTRPLFGQETSRKRLMHNYALVLQPGRNFNLDYQLILYQNREQETLNPIFPEDTTYNVKWGKQKRSMTGFRVKYAHPFLNNQLRIRAGAEAQWTEGSTDYDYLYFKYVDQQNFYGIFAQAELALLPGSLVTLGARIDGQSGIDKTYLSPVGSIQQWFADRTVGFYVTYGTQRRWIPLNEVNTFNRPARILGPPFLQGNVDLPETELNMELLRALDLGIQTRILDGRLTGRLNYFHLKNEGQFGAPVFEIRPVTPGAQIPPAFKAAIVATDRNLPGYDISQGMELEVCWHALENLSLFASLTRFLKSETTKYSHIALYDGPLGGPDAQSAINQSVGKFIIPYHGKAIIPGSYNWLGNFRAVYRPDSYTLINAKIRYRGETKDPIMKFGIDPGVNTISPVVITDVSLTRDILSKSQYRIKALLSVTNLFNIPYQTFVHYPMQGRYYFVGLTAEIF